MGRYRGKKKSILGNILCVLIAVAVVVFLIVLHPQIFAILMLLAALVVGAIYLRKKRCVSKNDAEPVKPTKDAPTAKQYYAKTFLLSYSEKVLYQKLLRIIGDAYIVQAQVPLGSIVEKRTESKYRTELFRIVDFGIFDKNWRPLIMIELNDSSHDKQDRRKRDLKVQGILREAGIPLLTLHTSYPNEEGYIRKRLGEHIPALIAESVVASSSEESQV